MTSVFVDDQEKARAAPDGAELLLEPNGDPISLTYQEAVHQAGIPATTFAPKDIHRISTRNTGG